MEDPPCCAAGGGTCLPVPHLGRGELRGCVCDVRGGRPQARLRDQCGGDECPAAQDPRRGTRPPTLNQHITRPRLNSACTNCSRSTQASGVSTIPMASFTVASVWRRSRSGSAGSVPRAVSALHVFRASAATAAMWCAWSTWAPSFRSAPLDRLPCLALATAGVVSGVPALNHACAAHIRSLTRTQVIQPVIHTRRRAQPRMIRCVGRDAASAPPPDGRLTDPWAWWSGAVRGGGGADRLCPCVSPVPCRSAAASLPSCAHPRRPARGGCRPCPRAGSTSPAGARQRFLVRRLCIAGGITPVRVSDLTGAAPAWLYGDTPPTDAPSDDRRHAADHLAQPRRRSPAGAPRCPQPRGTAAIGALASGPRRRDRAAA